MKTLFSSRFSKFFFGATAVALLIGLTTGLGVYVGNRMAQSRQAEMSPLQLLAGTATRSKSISMATGLIDNNVEGLFVLDHVSGNLQCWVLSPRTGQVGGIYRANVAIDLAGGRKAGEPDYVMTTGNFFFSGGNTGNDAPGQSICYVADSTSGNVVGYGLVYNKQGIRQGVMQAGLLRVVCKGTTRGESTTRDQ